jgi:hypothetical protein
MKKKRGKLSKEDIAIIEKFAGNKPDAEIADIINRTENTVAKYRKEHLGVGDDVENSEYIQYRTRLKDRPEYIQLKKVSSDDELEYATRQWTKYISQFKEDVLATEETQILQLIKFEIFMYRIEIDRKKNLDYKLKLEKKIEQESLQPNPSVDLIINFEEQIAAQDAAVHGHGIQYVKYQEKHEKILSSLKATRDQRIKNIQNASTTILGVIKDLEKEDTREQRGREMAIMKAGLEKETVRLGQLHKYDDDMLDQPLLNSRTVKMVNDDE